MTSNYETEMQGIYTRGNRVMHVALAIHMLLAMGMSFFYSTWALAIPVSLAAWGMFALCTSLVPFKTVTRIVAGISLQVFCALHIYQLHGLAEMHFFFFLSSTLLIVYKDPWCMWPGALLIIGQHIAFAFMANAGVPVYFWGNSALTLTKFGFHFGIALIQVSICSAWARLLRDRTRGRCTQQKQIEQATALIAEQLRAAENHQVELTEARERAEQLREQAVAATNAKSEFLARMSHEIRTPINGVLGMAELLSISGISAEQYDMVGAIRSSAESLLRIVNDILDFSKLEAGRLELDLAPFDLRSLLEDAAELMSRPASAKGVDLHCVVPPEFPALVLGDAHRLRQVVLNLLSNAVKFTESGYVMLSAVVRRIEDGHLDCSILVRDTGIGISPEAREHIFEDFVQADESIARKYGGTGLGLTICQQLVALMGGTIDLEPTLEQGSMFRVHLRLPIETATAAEELTIPAGTRAIVFSRNAHFCEPCLDVLRTWGVEAESLDQIGPFSQEGGLAHLLPANFVIVDCDLPSLTGQDLTTEIRRAWPACQIILAGRERLLRSEIDSVAADLYISKPIRFSRLRTQIGTLLQRQSRLFAKRNTTVSDALLRLRILVAEDNDVNRLVVLKQLDRLGCRATAVKNGLEALAALAQDPYDVILMDCQMPELDGFGATREIRKFDDPAVANIHIIALTALAMEGDEQRCREAGMNDYLAKPTHIDELKQKLLDFAIPEASREVA